MSDDIPQDQVEAVSRAICQSRTCEGFNCCQWPAQTGRRQCPVRDGGYEDAALAAIRVLTPMIAAVEREKLNAWMIRNSVATGHGDTIEDLLLELDRHIDMMDADFAHAAAVERKRCAKIADERVKRAEFGLVLPQIDRVPLMIRREEASIIAESIRSVKGAVT